MTENLIRIGYERLFNMGNFEHEKYTVNKEVEANNEFEAWKKLALDIVDFEAELVTYRKLCEMLPNVVWAVNHGRDDAEKEKLDKIKRMIEEFRTEHKPIFKECKCFYCKNKGNVNYDDNQYNGDLPF